jgi:hypothetical protein
VRKILKGVKYLAFIFCAGLAGTVVFGRIQTRRTEAAASGVGSDLPNR